MSHNARIAPDAFYANGVTLPSSWWDSIDAAQAESLSGDIGGRYYPGRYSSPSLPIRIEGAGVWLSGTASVFSGTAQITPSSLTFGDSDWPVLGESHSRKTRVLATPFSLWQNSSSGHPRLFTSALYDGVLNVAPPFLFLPGGRFTVPLRVHHGGTLTKVVFFFNLYSGAGRQALAARVPQVRVYAVDLAGVVTPMSSSSDVVGAGYRSIYAGSSVAEYTALSEFVYNCDGVTVDAESKAYFAEVVDEGGEDAVNGNAWVGCECWHTISDMGPE